MYTGTHANPDVWHSSSRALQEHIYMNQRMFGVDVTAAATTVVVVAFFLSQKPIPKTDRTQYTHIAHDTHFVLFPLHTKAHIIFPKSAHASLLSYKRSVHGYVHSVCLSHTHTHTHTQTTHFVAIVTHFTACIFSRQTHISSIHVKHLCCLSLSQRTNTHNLFDVFQHYLQCVFSVELISTGRCRRRCFSQNFNLIGH